MTIAENVYTDICSKRKLSKVKKKISKGKFCMGIYVITYPISEYGLLEIYDYKELMQKYYRDRDDKIKILGISKSKQGALELVTWMVLNMSRNWK